MSLALESLALSDDAAAVAERVRRSVVVIRSRAGGGAGTIWREDGLIITNSHVLPSAADAVEVVFGEGILPARVSARDSDLDLAALRVDRHGLPAPTIGDSAALRPGHIVFAVGNPWGQPGCVTAGVVLARTPAGDDTTGRPFAGSIRADVRLAPGNSGGPLADARGCVVGINAMIAGGVAIAIPSATVAAFVASEGAAPGFLGISARPVPLPAAIAASFPEGDGAGLLLTEVAPASAAEAAGLLPGDIVLAIDRGAHSLRAIARGLRSLRAGRPTTFELLRGGALAQIDAKPSPPPAA